MHAIFDVPLQHFILRARFSHCDTQTKALDVYPIVYVVRDENPLSDLNTEYSDRMSPESFSGSGRSPEGGCLLRYSEGTNVRPGGTTAGAALMQHARKCAPTPDCIAIRPIPDTDATRRGVGPTPRETVDPTHLTRPGALRSSDERGPPGVERQPTLNGE